MRRLGGQRVGRLYSCSSADGVDTSCSQYFLDTSRLWLFPETDPFGCGCAHCHLEPGVFVMQGGMPFISDGVLSGQSPTGPISSHQPWDEWAPPDLRCFFHARSTAWNDCLWEGHPYRWTSSRPLTILWCNGVDLTLRVPFWLGLS